MAFNLDAQASMRFSQEFLSKKRSKKEWDIISMLKSKRMEVKPEEGESFLKETVRKIRKIKF